MLFAYRLCHKLQLLDSLEAEISREAKNHKFLPKDFPFQPLTTISMPIHIIYSRPPSLQTHHCPMPILLPGILLSKIRLQWIIFRIIYWVYLSFPSLCILRAFWFLFRCLEGLHFLFLPSFLLSLFLRRKWDGTYDNEIICVMM